MCLVEPLAFLNIWLTLLTQESMLEDEFSNKTFFPQLIKDGCLTL